MLTFFVNSNQLSHFLKNKEPVKLLTDTFENGYAQFQMKLNKVIIKEYNTYYTIEIKTWKKVLKEWWMIHAKRKGSNR